MPAASGYVAGIYGSRNSVTAVISVASRQERASGKGKDSRQILITGRTNVRARGSGNKKILATGSSIVEDIPGTASGTGKGNGSGIGTGERTRLIMMTL